MEINNSLEVYEFEEREKVVNKTRRVMRIIRDAIGMMKVLTF